jgi:hypothetical protein
MKLPESWGKLIAEMLADMFLVPVEEVDLGQSPS